MGTDVQPERVAPRDIGFINPGGWYSVIVDRIIDGIAPHMTTFRRLSSAGPNVLNVHFFRELKDHATKGRRICPDFHVSHGWFQKVDSNVFWEQIDQFKDVGVPGPFTERYLLEGGIQKEKVHIIGHPGMDAVFQGRIAKQLRTEKRIVVVALSHSSYLGTWKDISELIPKPIRILTEVVEIVHPVRGWMIARDYLQHAAVCISDVSGTIFEAWALGVPVVFPSWRQDDRKGWKTPGSPLTKIYEEEIGYHAGGEHDFERQIRKAMAEGITNEEKEFIEDYFPFALHGFSGVIAAEKIERAWKRRGG